MTDDWTTDAETERLTRVLRSIDPVVHSLEIGPVGAPAYMAVVRAACVQRSVAPPVPPPTSGPGLADVGLMHLRSMDSRLGRDTMHAIRDARTTPDRGLDATLTGIGWLEAFKLPTTGAPMRVRPLTIAWARAHGVPNADDFDDDSNPTQVYLLRQFLALAHDPFTRGEP